MGHETFNFWVRRSKLKVTRGQREIWRRGRGSCSLFRCLRVLHLNCVLIGSVSLVMWWRLLTCVELEVKCIATQVVSVLRPTLDQYFPEQMGVRIIAEPGRYFAASAFTLAVNIIAKRTISSSDSTSSSPGNLCLPNLWSHSPCLAVWWGVRNRSSQSIGNSCRIIIIYSMNVWDKLGPNQGHFTENFPSSPSVGLEEVKGIIGITVSVLWYCVPL